MQYFYKLENGVALTGSGSVVPEGFIVYEKGAEPAELVAALAPKPEEIQQLYTAAVQTYLDDFARTKTYDGILSACTYITSTSPRWKAEGQRCVELRDAVWESAFVILNDVMDGKRAIPTLEQFIAELPKLTWG